MNRPRPVSAEPQCAGRVGRAELSAVVLVVSVEGEHEMLRLLLAAGALYAAFKVGREYGRTEAEVMLLPPVDQERRPTATNEEEFGEV